MLNAYIYPNDFIPVLNVYSKQRKSMCYQWNPFDYSFTTSPRYLFYWDNHPHLRINTSISVCGRWSLQWSALSMPKLFQIRGDLIGYSSAVVSKALEMKLTTIEVYMQASIEICQFIEIIIKCLSTYKEKVLYVKGIKYIHFSQSINFCISRHKDEVASKYINR